MGGLKERERLKEKERMKDAKERSKENDREKEARRDDGREMVVDDEASPTVGTPHHGHHAIHVKVEAKGWSDMLDGACN